MNNNNNNNNITRESYESVILPADPEHFMQKQLIFKLNKILISKN